MIIFALYGFLIWFLCFRWRRRPRGFAVAFAGAAIVAAIALSVRDGDAPGSGLPLRLLVYGEAALVFLGGLFIAALPRPPRGNICRYCWYDFEGLPAPVQNCPECGASPNGDGLTPRPAGRPRRPRDPDPAAPTPPPPITPDLSPTPSPPDQPQQQHPQRHRADQHPPDGGLLPR